MARETKEPPSPEDIRDWVSKTIQEIDSNLAYLVAETENQRRAGFMLLSIQPDDLAGSRWLQIETAYTVPAFRRRGAGMALGKAAEEMAKRIGATTLSAVVSFSNFKALEYWINRGFKFTGYVILGKKV